LDKVAYVTGNGPGVDTADHDIVTHGRKVLDEMAASQEEAQKRMAAVGAKAGLEGDRLQRHVIKTDLAGTVGRTAVAASEKLGADIAVFGSRGLGALEKTLLGVVGLGSVSDYAVRALNARYRTPPPPPMALRIVSRSALAALSHDT